MRNRPRNQRSGRWTCMAVLLSCISVAPLRAQPTLQITSPADGTLVGPGQSLTVNVAASGAFQQVAIVGGDPIGFNGPLTTPPYQFTIPIPSAINPGVYLLTAHGYTAPGQGTTSDPISIVVERSDAPLSLHSEPSLLRLSVGQNGYLRVIAGFSDGATMAVTKSTLITYTSDTPSVATVQAQGIVTAVAPGTAVITAAYGGLSFPVSVTVPQLLNIAPRGAAVYASQTQQFIAQSTGPLAPSVTWSVSPVGAGSIDGTGLYAAPSSIPVQQTVTIAAADSANDASATAPIVLFPTVSVNVAPSAASPGPSQTQKFTATVANALSTGVSWTISPSGAGSIDRTGLYTAPGSFPSQQVVTVTAASWADPTQSGSATITLQAASQMTINANTTPQSAQVAQVFGVPLSVTVTGANNNPVAGVAVTFTAPTLGASGTFANGTNTTQATTNASGVATATTFTANSQAGGPYNVTATAGRLTAVNFVLTNAPVSVITSIPSIYQTLAYYFPIGAEIDSTDLSGPHAQLLAMHFNSIVSGNDMTWSSTEAVQGNFTFSTADAEVSFAQSNSMKIRGYNLVWASGQQTPSWVFGDGSSSTANQALVTGNIREHIQNMIQHFGSAVYVWDVVNEPLDPTQSDCLSHSSPFYQVLGKSYVDIALQAARQYAPAGIELFINDNNTTDSGRLACLLQVVQDLKNRGIPIDGVGHEMHNAINYPSIGAMVNAIDTMANSVPGIHQQITEMDESIYTTNRRPAPALVRRATMAPTGVLCLHR